MSSDRSRWTVWRDEGSSVRLVIRWRSGRAVLVVMGPAVCTLRAIIVSLVGLWQPLSAEAGAPGSWRRPGSRRLGA